MLVLQPAVASADAAPAMLAAAHVRSGADPQLQGGREEQAHQAAEGHRSPRRGTSWLPAWLCRVCKHSRLLAQVNKIRDLGTKDHRNILVTHTDANELFVWNVDTQPPAGKAAKVCGAAGQALPSSSELEYMLIAACDAQGKELQPNVADLMLTGHEDKAMFALCCSSAAPFVGSGGSDSNVGRPCCSAARLRSRCVGTHLCVGVCSQQRDSHGLLGDSHMLLIAAAAAS